MIEKILNKLRKVSLVESAKTRGQQNRKNDFEDEVEHFISENFEKLDKSEYDLSDLVPGQKTDIKNGYISQPYGTQNPPDFIIFYNGIVYFIECKSVKKGGKPTWNTRFPKGLTIYLFHNRNLNETTFFLGKDVFSEELENVFDRQQRELREFLKKHEEELSNNNLNPYGFYNYGRNMYEQKKSLGGGSDFINDYFKNKDRQKLENNVIEFLKENI